MKKEHTFVYSISHSIYWILIVIILYYMLHYILDTNTTFLCINTYYNCPYVFTYCNLHYTTSVCICNPPTFPSPFTLPPRRILHLFLTCLKLSMLHPHPHSQLMALLPISQRRLKHPQRTLTIPVILTVSRHQPPAARHLC